MAVFTVYTLEASNITISGGAQLSGITQGDGSHLVGETITLNNNNWEAVDVDDSNDSSFGDSDNSQSLDAAITYDGTSYSSGLRVEAEYALTVQDPDGNTYTLLGFNINEPGVTSFATVEGLAFVGGVGGFPPIGVPLTVLSNQEGPNHTNTALATPACFTKGCMIRTPQGPRTIEDLRVGDWADTFDSGPQQIRWIGKHYVSPAVLRKQENFRPILIRKDAFGPGVPSKDLRVSPQHRVLLRDWRAQHYFGEDEILVPIKKLINDLTITVDHTANEVFYFHLLFDGHEVLASDGLWSESFLPGPQTGSLDTQTEALGIFPELAQTSAHPIRPARTIVDDGRARVLNMDAITGHRCGHA